MKQAANSATHLALRVPVCFLPDPEGGHKSPPPPGRAEEPSPPLIVCVAAYFETWGPREADSVHEQ